MHKDRLPDIALFITTLIWGNSFVAIKILVNYLSPTTIASLRFLIASPLFIAVLFLKRNEWHMERQDVGKFLLFGFLSVPIYHVFLNYGTQYIPAGTVTILIALNPMITALLASVMIGERIGRWKALGIALGFAGAATIAVSGEGLGWGHLIGVVLVVLATTSWAIYTVMSKPMLKRYHPLQLTAYIALIGTAMMAPSWPLMVKEAYTLNVSGWLALFYIGFICIAIGYPVWYWALSKKEASRTATFVYFIPISGIIGAYFILGEVPGPLAILGGALVLIGIWLVNRKID